MPVLDGIDTKMIGQKALSPSVRRWLSLLSLGLAIYIGWQEYNVQSFFGLRTTTVSLRPDFLAGLFSLLLVGALYARHLVLYQGTIYCLITFAFNVTIIAILMQALLGATATWLTSLPMPYLLCFAVIMTWTALKEFAQFAWLGAVLFGLINLISASNALGTSGFFFVLAVALGVLLQIDLGFDAKSFRQELSGVRDTGLTSEAFNHNLNDDHPLRTSMPRNSVR